MARSNTRSCQRGENRRQLRFDLLLGGLAAIAILHVAAFQLIDGLRIPHCWRAVPLSLDALFAPCAPADSQRAAISSIRAASSSHESPIAQ
jgi:hypothetical protein